MEIKEIPFEYTLDPTIGEPFVKPDDNTALRETIFTRADSFGTTVITPYSIIITPESVVLGHGSGSTRIDTEDKDFITIPLGIQLRIPEKIAFYHKALVPFGRDFIVERSDKPLQHSYNVNLYLAVTKTEGLTILKGTPVLKIMPITDADYNFHYRKKF